MKRVLLAALISSIGTSVWAGPAFVNGIAIPGETGDQFGTGVNSGRFGSFSDLYYDPQRKEFWGLSDRGPGGGSLSYETRVQRFSLDINQSTGAISSFQIDKTIKFSNNGAAKNGLSPSPSNTLGNAFDPEGFVINPRNGNFLVSDEYGPSLFEFDRDGNQLRAFKTPANMIPRNAATGEANYAGDAGNDAGKRTNRGFEGLAISPSGQFTYAMLQSAMLDEGGGNGTINRIVKFDNDTGEAVAQFAYKMEGSSQGRGISALVAINENEFLVLERNNRGLGVDANLASPNKKVFKINLQGATNLMGADLNSTADDISIPGGVLPAGVNTVTKEATPYLDLAANTLPELDGNVAEKWEGLSIGPMLEDGSFLMLAGTDNDYSVSQLAGATIQYDVYFRGTERIICDIGSFDNCRTIATGGGDPGDAFTGDTDGFRLIPGILHAYKASSADLAGYVAPVSEPATGALLLSALGLMSLGRRRKQA